jgi:SAM-dependent methyltransferase
MTDVFGHEYAEAYDLLYAEKDYEAECDLLERIFRESGRPVRTVLDLGCGTGAHAVRLAQRGYSVVGVDLSAEMLRLARERADSTSTEVELVLGDVRSVDLGRTFDAVICMFAVLGYQTTDADVADTLRTVRKHLVPGGPFVFDVWYGPAVEATGPERRVKVVPTTDGELERQAAAVLDAGAHLCTVSYRLVHRRNGYAEHVAEEVHRMRYFGRDELEALVARADMTLIDLRAFPELGAQPSIETWNVLATVRG